jgi:hypothetical protein
MGGFSPQPEGTGPIFPISSLLVASVIDHSALLASRTEKNWPPSPPPEVVLAGPGVGLVRAFRNRSYRTQGYPPRTIGDNANSRRTGDALDRLDDLTSSISIELVNSDQFWPSI